MHQFRSLLPLFLCISPVSAAAGPPAATPSAEAQRKPVASANELIQMGSAFADLKRFDEAITAYTLALEQEPDNSAARANRALAYAWTNRLDEASIDLAAAEKTMPDAAVIHRVRAILANRRSDQETELTELTKSLNLEPNNAFALRFRASIYQERRQYEAALVDAEAYRIARPDEPDAYLMKAQLLAAQKKWPLAIKQANLLTKRFSREPRALAAAAQIYGDFGDRAQALAIMNQAIALDDGFYYSWKVKAGLRRWDDFAGRGLDLRQALELAPGDLSIIVQLGLLEFDRRNWAAAHERFSEVLAKDEKDFGVLAYRALAALQKGDQEGAKADYETALAAASGPDDLSLICWAFATEGLALDWGSVACDRAVAADPTKAGYRVTRGLLRLRRADLDGAIADYDRAIMTDPLSASAYYGRALAYLRKGDRRRAAVERQQALAIRPTVEETFVVHGLRELAGSINE